MAQRIALFGGSFDPPHLGHLFAAVHARVVGAADAVWVLPVAHHPYGKSLRPWQQRWQLCQAAFADFPFIELRDDELHNERGHSVTLIEGLAQRYPQHQWLLVGGSDTAEDLVNWYHGERLASLVTVHPVPRRGWDDHHPAALPAISSTLVRQRLSSGLGVEDYLPHDVAQLIAQRQWYQDGDGVDGDGVDSAGGG